MIIGPDKDFVETVLASISPFQHLSATENIGPYLYSLVRMLKPSSLVEFGSGYTTPFILKALSDNRLEFVEYKSRLEKLAKENETELLDPNRRKMPGQDWLLDSVTQKVYGREPILPEPEFYLKNYDPVLYTFEVLPPGNAYVQTLSDLICDLDLSAFFRFRPGATIKGYPNLIEKKHLPVNFAWNDFGNKLRFFKATYPILDANGGVMLLHNTINGEREFREDLDKVVKLIEEYESEYRCELLSLVEPHKFTQRSCTMIRRISDCKEKYYEERSSLIDRNLLSSLRKAGAFP